MTQLTARASAFLAVRDKVIDAAIADKKILASSREGYVKMYDANPEGIWGMLTKPVREGGLMAGLVAVAAEWEDQTGYPPSWVPELTAQHGGSVAGEVPAPAPARVAATTAARAESGEYPREWLAGQRPASSDRITVVED